MRVFIAVLVLIFSLQSWTKADDIRDFEIEGISIGDNLLDHYTLKEINNAYVYKYKNDEFRYYILDVRSGTTYDYLQITVKSIHKNVIKPSDKLKIHSVAGIIRYKFNIDDCYPVQNRIKEELDLFFKIDGITGSKSHEMDKTKKSILRYVNYYLDAGSDYASATINCYDMSKEIEDTGFYDQLHLDISSQEFLKFINEKNW